MRKILGVGMFLISLTALGQQDGSYAGLQLGMGNMINNDTFEVDTELTYGVTIGGQLNDQLSLGAYINFYNTKEALDDTRELKVNVMPIMAELSFSLKHPAHFHTPYVSGLLGIARSQVRLTTLGVVEDSTETDTAAGFRVGYSFAVAPYVSISPDFTFVHVFYEDDDTTNGDDEFNVWNTQIYVRAWF